MQLILNYDNIPAENRAGYKLSGWSSKSYEGNILQSNVKKRINGANVTVWPNEVPESWVVTE